MTKKSSDKQSQPSPQDSKIQHLESQLARALADYANLEKRFSRDSSSVVKYANSSLLGKLLDLRDHLSATAAHFPDKSLTMILSLFDKLLSEEGVVEVKTDGPYDPATMECAEVVPGDKDRVITVQRKGYLLHDRVLRSARVTVGSGVGASPVSPNQ